MSNRRIADTDEYAFCRTFRDVIDSCIEGPEAFHIASVQFRLLIELYLALCEKRNISITGVSESAKVPATTGLRYLREFEQQGLAVRIPDGHDARRIWLSLSPRGVTLVTSALARIAGM